MAGAGITVYSSHFSSFPSFSERSEESTNTGTIIQTTVSNMDPSPTFHSGSGSDGGGWNY
ncbi:hypothetical protein GCM10027567_09860 [Spongiibacter taiwanensis]